MVIDTHAHLQFPEFSFDIEEVLKRASKAGVKKIINVGCNLEACERGLELIEEYDDFGDGSGEGLGGRKSFGVELFATLGLHPYDVEFLTEEVLKDWEEKIKKFDSGKGNGKNVRKIVAIGEIGLDYFKSKVPKDVQKDAFKRQLEFALKVGFPIIVHNREADEDSLRILKEVSAAGVLGRGIGTGGTSAMKVVFHCYGSSLDFAKELWKGGFYTSFTGVITYPNASNLREVVKECPLDRWMVETDCPYLAPQGFRGKRNEPSYVVEVLKKVAELKGLAFEDCEKLQEENAKNFYGVI